MGYRYYPELNTYKIRAGRYAATLTAYDYATHNFTKGAAHAMGGTLSLLFKGGKGPLIAGSTYEYKLTEPNNMQTPAGERRHATLLPRAEYSKNGISYATCLDPDPEITVRTEDNAVTALVRARFCSLERSPEDASLVAEFRYYFTPESVTVTVKKINENVRFVLPLIAGEMKTTNPYAHESIFFLNGGFAAEECVFSLGEDVLITIV